MVDGGLWVEWKEDAVRASAEVVVEECISAGALHRDRLPDVLAAVPKKLLYCARVGLQGA